MLLYVRCQLGKYILKVSDFRLEENPLIMWIGRTETRACQGHFS